MAERLLEAGAVLVDGTPLGKSQRLSGGEELEFEPPVREVAELTPEPMDLRIAYEDEHLMVVDKPAGLVVHPASGHATGTLVQGLLEHDIAGGDAGRPGIVHRLDRDTSGLMVVARSEEAYARLQDLVRSRALERHYAALVVGRPRSRSGRVEAPIGRDRRDPLRQSLDTDKPREAITHFEVKEVLERHTLLDVQAGDRPHPPDPRAPRCDRSPRRRRHRSTDGPASSVWSASSSMQSGSPSRIPSRRSGWTWSRRCPPI